MLTTTKEIEGLITITIRFTIEKKGEFIIIKSIAKLGYKCSVTILVYR